MPNRDRSRTSCRDLVAGHDNCIAGVPVIHYVCSAACDEMQPLVQPQRETAKSRVAVLEPRSDHAMAAKVRFDGPHCSIAGDQ